MQTNVMKEEYVLRLQAKKERIESLRDEILVAGIFEDRKRLHGAAAEIAAKDFNWSWFSGYGTKLPEAGRVLNPFKKSKPGDIKALLKYGTRLTPIPAKTSWQIYKNLGLGPLAYAWGVGALKRYIGLVYAFTLVRFVLMMGHEISKGPDNPDGSEVLRRINEFFGIPEYDGDSLYNPVDWLTNIAKSSYFPRAF